uniref:glutathionylspermidine synthase family protein n=1 Tax=Ningiella ruwaisensis TaxID=2364274 RepID=UPI0010A0B01A|nr:glutathionylspermidine synthase family protein [Ningiella ruwaisensis]
MTQHTKADAKFGEVLGIAPGGVEAYCCDYDTLDESQYPSRSSLRHCAGNLYFGYKWQCVEFARRWLYVNTGCIFDDVGMAYEIFKFRHLTHVETQQKLPLQAYENGSLKRPQAGALLIWEEGGEFEHTGHVAIVTEVSDHFVRVAEQNVHFTPWAKGTKYSRELRAKEDEQGRYWISCTFADTEILGWMLQTSDASLSTQNETQDPSIQGIQLHRLANPNSNNSWLNIANEDEDAYVKAYGFHGLSEHPDRKHAFFCVSGRTATQLEHATNELHEMFIYATHYVLSQAHLLSKFNLPEEILPKLRRSWENRQEELVTSRFDFALSDQGLKVYEYNCDSASCYMETAKIQGKWAKHHHLDTGTDAGAGLSQSLIKKWRESKEQGHVHIMYDDDPEELYHAYYMQSIIESAGIETTMVLKTQGLALIDGDIVDANKRKVKRVWKTWAWETALDQIREELTANSASVSDISSQSASTKPVSSHLANPNAVKLSDVLFHDDIMVYEPLWSLIPSNKAILPILSQLFPQNQWLLNASFQLTPELKQSGYVAKPIVGRCGANISVVDANQQVLESTGGKFDSQDQIYQAFYLLPKLEQHYVQLCTFTAGGTYAGACTRVDTKKVINKDSDCMALRFIDNSLFRAKR